MVDAVRLSRVVDLPLDVGRLLARLGGLDLHSLHHAGHHADQDCRYQPDSQRTGGHHHAADGQVDEEEHCQHQGEQCLEHCQCAADVHVGVTGAVDDAVVGRDQVVAVQHCAERDNQCQQPQQGREMADGAAREAEIDGQPVPGVEAGCQQSCEEDKPKEPALQRSQKRHRQQIKAHVQAEQRLADAARTSVDEEKPLLPAGTGS